MSVRPGFIAVPFAVRVGRHQWRLISELRFRSFVTGRAVTYTVPAGFVSDGESVPEIPGVYHLLAEDDTRIAGFLHDYLYREAFVSRDHADSVYLEALDVLSVQEKAARMKKAWVSGSLCSVVTGSVSALTERVSDMFKNGLKWVGVRMAGWMFYNNGRNGHDSGDN